MFTSRRSALMMIGATVADAASASAVAVTLAGAARPAAAVASSAWAASGADAPAATRQLVAIRLRLRRSVELVIAPSLYPFAGWDFTVKAEAEAALAHSPKPAPDLRRTAAKLIAQFACGVKS